MKHLISTFILTISLGIGISFGQGDKKSTGIYNLYINISEELTTEFKATDNSRNFLNGYSESAIFPDNLLDSVRTITEVMLSEKLDSKVSCTYKTNKKGKKISTVGANNELEGMPTNTFKNALTQSKFEQYAKVSVSYTTGGTSIDFGFSKRSKVKPKVSITIVVFDRDKNEVWKGKANIKDFGKLRQVSRTRGDVTVKKSETLTPEDIFMMYEMVLIEAVKN
jgi:hypothetical protein